jgi:hypothetical protein
MVKFAWHRVEMPMKMGSVLELLLAEMALCLGFYLSPVGRVELVFWER